MSGVAWSPVYPELNVSCSSCGTRSGLVRRVHTPEGMVRIVECVVCDRARCGSCDGHVPGSATFCPSCGWYLLGPRDADPEVVRMLAIAGMHRCDECRTYVSDGHACAEAA